VSKKIWKVGEKAWYAQLVPSKKGYRIYAEEVEVFDTSRTQSDGLLKIKVQQSKPNFLSQTLLVIDKEIKKTKVEALNGLKKRIEKEYLKGTLEQHRYIRESEKHLHQLMVHINDIFELLNKEEAK
jgi:hypothetical protein